MNTLSRRLVVLSSRTFLAGALCAAVAASCNSSGTSGTNPSGTDMAGSSGNSDGGTSGNSDGGTSGGGDMTGGGGSDMPGTGTLSLGSISPALGPSTGNVAITLTGTGFSTNTTVTINGVAATVTNVTSSQLTVTLPQQLGVKGKVPVRVQNGAGDVTRSDLFAYYYGRLEFEVPSKVNVGNGPYWVGIDDFDKDGKLDVAASLYFANQVAVLTGQGSGAFNTAIPYNLPAGARPTVMAISDLNKDGYQDLITANYTANNVSTLLNQKNGTFAAAVSTMSGDQPNYLAVQDVTGDGFPDAVVANVGAAYNDFRLLRGKGDGTLNPPAGSVYVDAIPSTLAIADVDKDGKPDLLLGNMNTGKCSVLTGDGTGNFSKKGDVFVGSQPWSFATADMDGDGALDLVSSLNAGGGVAVLLGTGTGSFGVAKKTDLGMTSLPSGLALADFDADQRPDVAVALYGDNQVAVLRNAGAGALAGTPVLLSSGVAPRSVAIGDVNNDGKPDLISANFSDNTISIFLNKSQ
jgi:hypothetical protein